MRFSMREWLKLYRAIHSFGEKLRMYHYAKEIPEGMRLSRDTVALYQKEIESLTKRAKRYLDGCGMPVKKTPWEYKPDDKKTWVSHESFAYNHLLPKSQYCKQESRYEYKAA